MFGPDNTDGTRLSPKDWGGLQAEWALADWQRWYGEGAHRMPLRILWMDVEVPGSYGWGSNGAANREVFNGFWDYVTQAHEGIKPGVYSTNYQWGVIMSGHTGLPHTWEWTAQVSVARLSLALPDHLLRLAAVRRILRRPTGGEPAHRDMAVVAGQRRLRPDRHEQARCR